jgi:hypothetical protein
MAEPLNRAFFDAAVRQALAQGLPITSTLVDNFKLGSFWVRVLVTINTTDTTITHQLGRIPSIYLVGRSQAAGVVYDGTNLGSDWTTTQIVLRASTAGRYDLLIG